MIILLQIIQFLFINYNFNNESTILFNKGYEEYENKNYAASLKHFLDSERRDDSTYHNISLCYYNIGITFYNNEIYPKALFNFKKCLKYAKEISIKSNAKDYIRSCKAYKFLKIAGKYFEVIMMML